MISKLVTQENVHEHIVVNLMSGGYFADKIRSGGVTLYELGMTRQRPSPFALFKLIHIIRKHKPDILQTWLYHADLFGTLAWLLSLRKNKTRLIWSLRCSDIELENYRRSTLWTLKALTLLSHLPAIILSNSEAGYLVHKKIGYKPPRWKVIPNGFDMDVMKPDKTDRAATRKSLKLDDDHIAVCLCARVDPTKDHVNFIAASKIAAEKNPNLIFILVGLGTSDLMNDIKALGLEDRYRVLGLRHDMEKLWPAMDISVLCSAFGEGFPNVIGEAMAYALPCVTTDVGDAAEILSDCGITVPIRDSVALAEAMIRMAANPPEELNRIGDAARQRLREQYSLDSTLKAYREVYAGVGLPR